MLQSKEHAALFSVWRHDPLTVKMSFHQNKMNETEFWDYFQTYFVIKELPPVFAVVDGKRVGFIGFRPHFDQPDRLAAEVAIVIAPEARGQGIGARFLKACVQFAKQQGCYDLYAKIRPDNSTSVRIFEGAGFQYVDTVTDIIEDAGVDVRVESRLFHLPIVAKTVPSSVFIIGEAGSNWRMGSYERDLKMARALIEVAKEAGCDAVKFQTYRPETVYVPNAGVSDYLGTDEEITAIFEDLSMPYKMIPELAKMCDDLEIEFMSTAFSQADFEEIDPYVKRHKIASYELSHVRLLECAARAKKPLLLSTGAATIQDIEWAVKYYRKIGGGELSLLQCSAAYPAEAISMNLRAITTMQRYFQLPVGLSDHSSDPITAPIAAVALGATVVEKHFTLDRRLPGPDHSFAIVPDELGAMCRGIRLSESMRGTGVKEVLDAERELYQFARRRIQAIREIRSGEQFCEGGNIAILRPGKQRSGCHPKYIEQLVCKKATRDIALGDGIQFSDWKEN